MYGFRLYYTGIAGEKFAKRPFGREVLTPGFAGMGKHWFTNFRDKHFTEAGAAEYGYTKRKGENLARGSKKWKRSYMGQKWRKHKHQLPLVFSGEARRLSRIGRIAATAKGVRVLMPRLGKLNYRHPKSKVDMRREMTTISNREVEKLVQVGDRAMAKAVLRSGFRVLKQF